jgi:hypothetical protein
LTHTRKARRLASAAVLAALACAAGPAASHAAVLKYPDLRTLPPSDLRFETVNYQGVTSKVLRFSNTVWNAGQGALELHGAPGGTSAVTQRIFDDAGGYAELKVGDDFTFHVGHNHFHFGAFAEYELWTKSAFDAWVASGRNVGRAQKLGTKTSFCVMDVARVQSLVGAPLSPFYSQCGATVQGMSVGWGDTYAWSLPEQWIDLGGAYLSDGTYVLRSIADPMNKLYESDNRSDATREGAVANEALTVFSVKRGRLRIER